MNYNWDANLLLTQHFGTPICFYLHESTVDLKDIKMHIHNRIHGVDKEGKHNLLHKEDILFAFPVEKMPDVMDHIRMFPAVKNLKLTRKSIARTNFSVDDLKLESVIGDNIAIVTRRGHIIRGELQAFDKCHLFMQVGKEIILVYRNGLFGFKEEIEANLTQNHSLSELREKRKKWVEANRENDFEEGIKHLLTDLYPDDAHFIYELLQNAEDAGASEVRFVLNKNNATFAHNGNRLFSLKDVEAITSIGFSTKKDDPTSIGKFGIGFKAVFAYTATPEIESGEFHFRIRDMVVPDIEGLFPGALGEGKTRFVFPFDNPKKSSEKACAEIEKNLRELNENTLLFLSNIRKIEYQLPDSTTGSLERKQSANDKNRIEISVMRPGNLEPDSIYYLRFTKDVNVQDEDDELKRCQIAVAFGMDKPKSGIWKITPLNPGQVSIYFPATKETSNLRFHLHAPFASTVARDSIRACPANDELQDNIADLVAESMHTIRDRGWLDVEFLTTLPNSRDNLPPFYLPIQKRLIEEFNTEKLTPMKRRLSEYAAASGCYRGSSTLSNVINDEDLAVLLEKDRFQPLWTANPRQINQREDNFLTMLGISEWTTEDLIQILSTSSESVIEWLEEKSDEWHQDLYILLDVFLSRVPSYPSSAARESREKLSNLRIIRCSDGEYRVGNDCHFFGNDVETDEDLHSGVTILAEGSPLESEEKETYKENFHYVASAVYSSGNSKSQQERARKFLETIGVREVDDAERVKAILEQRYRKGSIKPREGDMEKFITLVEDQPEKKLLFKDYFIFEVNLKRDDNRWFMKPVGVFVDSPYLYTGLTAYHTVLREDSDSFKRALSPNYAESSIDLKRFGKFAETVGAQTELEIICQCVLPEHPEHKYLVLKAPGQFRSDTKTSIDYTIAEFRILLDVPSIDKSKLIWRTMTETLSPDHLEARYSNNRSQPDRVGASSLVHKLRNAEWVPQENGESMSFVQPNDALITLLPDGFRYEKGQGWLDAIEFGKITKEQREESVQRDQQAKGLGFDSSEEAEKYAKLRQLLKDEEMTVDDVISRYRSHRSASSPDFPTSSVKNPELRKERVLEQLSNAPKKGYEMHERRKRVSKDEIDHRTSLREWYTNDSGEMICQICKEEMPFKKTDGEYYFEAVEALTIRFKDDELPENHFPKEHESQYLALCPECAARYNYFAREAKGSIELMEKLRNQLMNSDHLEFSVCLGELETSVRFVETHLHDLKAILRDDTNLHDPEDSTD